MYEYDAEALDGNYMDEGYAPVRSTRHCTADMTGAPAYTRRNIIEIARGEEL